MRSAEKPTDKPKVSIDAEATPPPELALEDLEKTGWIGGKKIRIVLEDGGAHGVRFLDPPDLLQPLREARTRPVIAGRDHQPPLRIGAPGGGQRRPGGAGG